MYIHTLNKYTIIHSGFVLSWSAPTYDIKQVVHECSFFNIHPKIGILAPVFMIIVAFNMFLAE